MIVDYITHGEAMIKSFVKDPEFAEYYLNEVLSDGDMDEIREVQEWYDEAQMRRAAMKEAVLAV